MNWKGRNGRTLRTCAVRPVVVVKYSRLFIELDCGPTRRTSMPEMTRLGGMSAFGLKAEALRPEMS
jgi:hypothetical protein